jgi:hypothetical protein
LISNFRRVLNVECFLLGYSPASVEDGTECSETSAFQQQTPMNHQLAYEGGTDRVFRNVGISTTDADESPIRL